MGMSIIKSSRVINISRGVHTDNRKRRTEGGRTTAPVVTKAVRTNAPVAATPNDDICARIPADDQPSRQERIQKATRKAMEKNAVALERLADL